MDDLIEVRSKMWGLKKVCKFIDFYLIEECLIEAVINVIFRENIFNDRTGILISCADRAGVAFIEFF